jgi:dienelactone hydrolase
MRQLIVALFGIVFAWGTAQAAAVSFKAADGGTVYADATSAEATARGTILLFHQAGSNRAEYLPIAPRLVALGYNVLAVDQRSGGDMWNHENQTQAARGRGTDFLDVLPDLDGALAYAQATWTGVPVIAWGSSYSASLVFFLAAKHPDAIAAVLSFSPGEYFPETSVRDQAARTHCPVFITSASSSGEVAAGKHLLEAVPDEHKVQYVPQHGVHGSSTLRTDANPAGAAAAWTAVTEFLAALPPAAQTATKPARP